MYKNVIKRLIDIIISLMLIPFILILIIPVALFIKLEDHGDVFYNAERYGCNMKKFKMFKFRSMKMNAPDVRNADGTTFNSEKDVRLTKIGGFLRKTSIDELPQIFNVLLGDMSFVGPRPDVPGYADKLEGDDRRVLQLRPGITGPASLKYRDEEVLLAAQANPQEFNDKVIYPDKVRINLYYLDHYSFVADIKMIIATVLGKRIEYNNEII